MNGKLAMFPDYGALEIKRAYRQNMMIGILIACALMFAAVSATMISAGQEIQEIEEVTVENCISNATPDTIWLIPPPPPLDPRVSGQIKVPEVEELNLGAPVAVNDDEIVDERDFITSEQLRQLAHFNSLQDFDDFSGDDIVIAVEDTLLPAPDSFIYYEEEPEIIQQAMPIYPEIARRAGVTGDVLLYVLIDKNGKVRDVKAMKSFNPDVGFEEAAVAAAYKSLWKPAVSSGQPIAVWTTYKVRFVLAN